MLTPRKYDDKNGKPRIAFEIVANDVEICEAAKPAENAAPSHFEEITNDGNLPF